jgi:hypothetical protein
VTHLVDSQTIRLEHGNPAWQQYHVHSVTHLVDSQTIRLEHGNPAWQQYHVHSVIRLVVKLYDWNRQPSLTTVSCSQCDSSSRLSNYTTRKWQPSLTTVSRSQCDSSSRQSSYTTRTWQPSLTTVSCSQCDSSSRQSSYTTRTWQPSLTTVSCSQCDSSSSQTIRLEQATQSVCSSDFLLVGKRCERKSCPGALTLCLEDMWSSGGMAPSILDLGTRWRWVVCFTPRPLYPRGNRPRHPSDRRMDGPQKRSQRCREYKSCLWLYSHGFVELRVI